MSKFLKAGELQEAAVIYEAEVNSLPVVEIKDGEFRWYQEASQPTIEGIELQVGPSELVAILGRVGSGKVGSLNEIMIRN